MHLFYRCKLEILKEKKSELWENLPFLNYFLLSGRNIISKCTFKKHDYELKWNITYIDPNGYLKKLCYCIFMGNFCQSQLPIVCFTLNLAEFFVHESQGIW